MKLSELTKPWIIAEIGSNWRNFEDCLASIWAAKNCGADAVKFQLYTDEELYGFDSDDSDSSDGNFGYLNPEWLPALKTKADECKIEFMCTAFSPEGIKIVDPFVNIHKLASAENNHVLMHEALKETGKPIIISLGATIPSERKRIYETFLGFDVAYLYCVANYPAKHINLESINTLREEAPGAVIGFSDHSTDFSTIPVEATGKLHQAEILEKHFDPIGLAITPDSPHSINQEQFKVMVAKIRGTYYGYHDMVIEELPMIMQHRRRLIMKKDCNSGDEIIFGDHYGIYRLKSRDHHTGTTPPEFYKDFHATKLKKAKKRGDELGQDDIQGTKI